MMAGVNNQAAGLLNGLYQTGAAQNASTQADYRDKMAQADIMDTKAENMAKGAKLMPWAAALQGAGQGAQVGGIFGSDENIKEADDGIDDNKLNEDIAALDSFCRENDVMSIAAVQLGIAKRIIYLIVLSILYIYCWYFLTKLV